MTYWQGWLLQIIPLTVIIYLAQPLTKWKAFAIGALVGAVYAIGTFVK
jgi:hypothetical protein